MGTREDLRLKFDLCYFWGHIISSQAVMHFSAVTRFKMAEAFCSCRMQ